MKFSILFLLLSASVFAQNYIQKSDGTKINVEKGIIHPAPNKVYYIVENQKKKSVKMRDVDFAAFDGYFFRTAGEGKKKRGYYLIADMHGKSLAVSVQTKTKNTGGFHSYFKQYEVAVMNNGVISQPIKFTNSDTGKNPELRQSAEDMIRREFASCRTLIERLDALHEEQNSRTILNLLDNLRLIPCD